MTVKRSLSGLAILIFLVGWIWYIGNRNGRNTVPDGAIELTNADFTYGTYIIDQPGYYVLAEDISFNPNSPATLEAAVESGAIPSAFAEMAGWTEGVDAYSASFPLPTQLGGHDGPFTPGNPLEARYNPAAYGIGFFAAIAVQADGVTLDLNGHTIEQSAEHALLQRFFAVIELADQPFIPEQGPHGFGQEIQSATNVEILNGTIGRSSHHGIHGNANSGVTVRDVVFDGYEVGAVALNGVTGLTVENSTATNRKDVPVLGTFSSAQFLKAYVDALVRAGSTTTLEVNGEVLDVAAVQLQLRNSINAVHEDVILDNHTMSGYAQIDPSEHPVEYGVFHNRFGLIDGNSYSFLVNQVGVAVDGFPTRRGPEPDALSSDVVFDNVHVTDQLSFINETVALDMDGAAAIDPIGAVFQVRNTHPDTGDPVTMSSLDETSARYVGNPIANAQALVAKAAAAGEFNGGHLDSSRVNLSPELLAWVEGRAGSETLADIGAGWLCNGDSMFHVNKGAIAFKMDAVQGVTLTDTSVSGLANYGTTGSSACGDYTSDRSHPKATLTGYGGNSVRAYTFAGASNVVVSGAEISDLESTSGPAAAIALLTDATDIAITDVLISDVEAGLGGPTNGPAPDPYAMGFYVGRDVTNVKVSDSCATDLRGAAGIYEIHDETGTVAHTSSCSQ